MRSAKYPRIERNKWYVQVELKGKTVKEVCETFGISRQCYYEWHKVDRAFRRQYRTDLPAKRQPSLKMTEEVKEFVRAWKRKANYGPLKMHLLILRELHVSISTTVIFRFYRAEHLIRKPQRKQPWYEPLKHKLNITKPGEGVQMDVKYVYPRSKRMYQFSVFDPTTEIYHFSICKTKESRNCILAFKEAERYFGFKICSVQTDNGSEARGEFHKWLTKKDIPHYFIPKKSPWWNGKVERVHRTMDEEYYHNPLRIWKTPFEWLHYYNTERIHLTLGGKTPREKARECHH